MVSDEQIVVRLRQLLTEVDIATATGSQCCCRHIVEVISCVLQEVSDRQTDLLWHLQNASYESRWKLSLARTSPTGRL